MVSPHDEQQWKLAIFLLMSALLMIWLAFAVIAIRRWRSPDRALGILSFAFLLSPPVLVVLEGLQHVCCVALELQCNTAHACKVLGALPRLVATTRRRRIECRGRDPVIATFGWR